MRTATSFSSLDEPCTWSLRCNFLDTSLDQICKDDDAPSDSTEDLCDEDEILLINFSLLKLKRSPGQFLPQVHSSQDFSGVLANELELGEEVEGGSRFRRSIS